MFPSPLDCLEQGEPDRTCYHFYRFNEHVTKPEQWTGECDNLRHPSVKTPLDLLSWTRWSQGKDRTDILAGKAPIISGFLSEKPEVLRCLRHYLRAASQRHHNIDRLEGRSVERECVDDLL